MRGYESPTQPTDRVRLEPGKEDIQMVWGGASSKNRKCRHHFQRGINHLISILQINKICYVCFYGVTKALFDL